MKICIIGAGKTGRGFIADLFSENNEIIFIDTSKTLVNMLSAGSYKIKNIRTGLEKIISSYRVYELQNPLSKTAIEEADAVFISIKPENYPSIIDYIRSENVFFRSNPVICENAVIPAALMQDYESRSCSCAIFNTTIENGSLDILSEGYPYLHADASTLPSCLKNFDSIKKESDFNLLMLRKIYTYNAASAIISYNGALKGYESYAEAANDADIQNDLKAFFSSINSAISAQYGVSEQDQLEFSHNANRKFTSREIIDTVERNARNPLRKLSENERIIAPMKLIEKYRLDCSPLYRCAAAALIYADIKTAEAASDILYRICCIDKKSESFSQIINIYKNYLNKYNAVIE